MIDLQSLSERQVQSIETKVVDGRNEVDLNANLKAAIEGIVGDLARPRKILGVEIGIHSHGNSNMYALVATILHVTTVK